jgi:hypothetical protein
MFAKVFQIRKGSFVLLNVEFHTVGNRRVKEALEISSQVPYPSLGVETNCLDDFDIHSNAIAETMGSVIFSEQALSIGHIED